MEPSPRSSSPVGTALLLGVLLLFWLSLWRGVDPTNLFRQHIDNQMFVLEMLLAFSGLIFLAILLRSGRLQRLWTRPLRRAARSGLATLQPAATSLELGAGGALTVDLVAGPEHMPSSVAVREALAAGEQVLLVGEDRGTTRKEILGRDFSEGLEIWRGPVSEADLSRWIQAQRAPFRVVLAGARGLGSWMLAERVETRLARLIDGLARPKVQGRLQIIEPLALDRVVRPDALAKELMKRIDKAWLWDGEARRRPMLGGGGIGWWLVLRRDRPALGPGGSLWEGRAMALLTLAVLGLAIMMVLWPTLDSSYGGTPLLGRMDDALPGSLWSNWWTYQWWIGEEDLFFSDTIFWPQGASIVPLLGSLGASLLSLPLQILGSYPGYWNTWVCLCLLSNGLATVWLARVVGADRGGALLAGLAMTLASPVLVEVDGGHQSQFLMAGLPLSLGLAIRVLDLGRWWESWLLGLSLVLTSLIWWVMGGVAWALVIILAIHRIWLQRGRKRPIGMLLWRTLRIWLPCLLMAGPLLVAANNKTLKGVGWGRLPHDLVNSQVEDLMLVGLLERSASPQALLVGDAGGGWGIAGAVLLMGLLTSWWILARTRARLWGKLTFVAGFLALGPYLHPKAGFSSDWLVLPTGWVQALVPFATRFHQPDRMLIIAALGLAIMMGLVYRPLQLALPRRLRSLPLSLGILCLFVLPWGQQRLPLEVYDFEMPGWYEMLGNEGVMIEVPMGLSEVPAMYQPLHGRSVATGPGVVRELADADGYRALIHTNPGINKLVEYNPMAKDAADLMRLREDGLRYVIVNNAVIEYFIATQGMDRARVMLLVSRWLDNALGPPVLSAYQARVYRIPDEAEGTALLDSQIGLDSLETAAIYDRAVMEDPDGRDTESMPEFEDIREAFSPDFVEPAEPSP